MNQEMPFLSKKLSKLISDKAKREFFGFNGRKLAENQFSLEMF